MPVDCMSTEPQAPLHPVEDTSDPSQDEEPVDGQAVDRGPDAARKTTVLTPRLATLMRLRALPV